MLSFVIEYSLEFSMCIPCEASIPSPRAKHLSTYQPPGVKQTIKTMRLHMYLFIRMITYEWWLAIFLFIIVYQLTVPANLLCNNEPQVRVFELGEGTSQLFDILFCQMQHGPAIKVN